MAFPTGNLPFSGSARQPADDSKHRTAQQLARGLPTGWGNDHSAQQPGYHSAPQPGQHSHRSSAEPPAGELSMAWGVSLKWTTCPSKWKDSAQIFATHLHAAPRMQAFATTRTNLREIPWRRILEHLLTTAAIRMNIPFDAPKLLSAVVEAAGMSTLDDLTSYLHEWRAVSERVQAVLDWQISAKEMCERNRPGAWLADCMITELKVREQGLRSSVHYHAVGNPEYQIIGQEMGIAQECGTNSSANNVGNQLECLCWVALEEDRPEWIIALVWHAHQLESNWCSRKKLKSSAAVTAATEADELFLIRSDLHPAHETQRSFIEAQASRAASQASEVACGMVYEANVSPVGAVAKRKAASMGQSSEESAAPAPPPKAKLPDSAWLSIAKDPWRAKGIALPWREDHPQRPLPRAERSAPSSSSTAKPPAPDAATPPFLKPKPKTKSMQIGDSTFRARLETRSITARGTPVIPQEAGALKAAGVPNTPTVVHPKPRAFRAASQVASAPASSATVSMFTVPDSDAHPVHEPESHNDEPLQSTARTAEAHFARGLQLECCSKPPDVELDESDLEDAKHHKHLTSITSISGSAQAASQASPPSASSATVIMPRESHPAHEHSDAHPVHEPESDSGEDSASLTELHNDEPLQSTPLWDTFLENLQLVSDEENRRDFANFIQHHCFREDHFFKDSRGHTVDTKIPLSVKMESLFQTAWHRRKLALERLRQNGVTINDETYELNDNDMKTLPQLRLPGRHILIVCEWD